MDKPKTYKLAIIHSHPIQYSAPLYRCLAKEPSIDLTVFYCSRKGTDAYFDPGFSREIVWDVNLLDGYKYVFLSNLKRIESFGGVFLYTNPSIISFLGKGHYDAVLVNGRSYVTYLLGAVASKIFGYPLFIREVVFILPSESKAKNAIRKLLLKQLYRIYDVIYCIGKESRRYYQNLGINEAKLLSLPYAVDNDFFLQAISQNKKGIEKFRQAVGASCTKPIILYVGKLIERKRVMDLLQAFRLLQERGVSAILVIVGDGQDAGKLQKYVKDNKIQNVHFEGFINQMNLPQYYGASDFFVFPTSLDPWGAVINEAMIARLPIIVTRNAAAASDLVKHGENGFLYNVGDIRQLTSAMESLVLDQTLRHQMGQRSFEIIQRWNYITAVQRILSTLETVVSRKPQKKSH